MDGNGQPTTGVCQHEPQRLYRPTPYTVICDSREQMPYKFEKPLVWGVRLKDRPFRVQTTTAALPSGDYSLAGFESQIAVERKSITDLFGTLGGGRVRFHRELERLAAMTFAAVVIEAEWSTILAAPPPRSRLLPKTVFLSVVAWQQRFPAVHWWTVPNRDVGEATTIRILDRWWRERNA